MVPFDYNLINRWPDNYRLAFGLNFLKSDFRKVFFQKGEILFAAGNDSTGLYFLEEGIIKLSRFESDGQEEIVKIAQAGDILGFSALFKNATYRYSATILADATLTFIPKENFLEQMDGDGPVDTVFSSLATKLVNGIAPVAIPFKNKRLIDTVSKWPSLKNLFWIAKERVIRFSVDFTSEEHIVDDVRVIPVLDQVKKNT